MSSSPATASATSNAKEIQTGERFGFGANWSRFLRHLDDARIRDAEQSLQQMLGDFSHAPLLQRS